VQFPRLAELIRQRARELRIVGLVAAGWSAFACLYVMFGRLLYPYELEWMTGSVLDHVERVQQGLPVYAPPTASWIPFLYPPLYYWVSAAVARVFPLVLACRTVSIVSTLVQAACIWRLSRRRGATPYWSALGVGAFFAAFSAVDFWYDIERPDSLFMAMVLVGSVLLDEVRGLRGAIASGLVLGLAFFAKQPATMFLLAAPAALVLRGEWKRAAAFVAAAGVVMVALVIALDASTGGSFAYYVLKMPFAHGMSWSLVPLFFFVDLPHVWAWAIASAALVGAFARRPARAPDDAVFMCFLAASFVATMTSRLHIGGWSNVLSFWMAFGSAAVAVYGARLEAELVKDSGSLNPTLAALLPVVVAAQFLACGFAPGSKIPPRMTGHKFAALIDDIHELEKKGEVIAFGRGHLTTARHFHVAALIDVVTVEHAVPETVLQAIRERRFAAIVIDNLDDLWMPLHPEIKGELFFAVTAGYSVAHRIDERVPAPILGWPARPRWVLVPRGERLDEHDRTQLVRRSLSELNLAQIGYALDPDHVNDLANALRHVGEEAERDQDREINARQ
jgi:glycosyl transferase family 87